MNPETDPLKDLGKKIKEIRNEKGLSLNNVSKKAGFEKARLWRLEAGKVNITVKTLYKLGHALEVPIKNFFD